MIQLYRIARTYARATDISGMGAYKLGGRWNNPGTYLLYTSENSSLAYLENLVHFDSDIIPSELFITCLHINDRPGLIYTLPEDAYPGNWMHIGSLENKRVGDRLMGEREYLGIRIRSAVNTREYNYLLNPLFAGYHDRVRIVSVDRLPVDNRLIAIRTVQR